MNTKEIKNELRRQMRDEIDGLPSGYIDESNDGIFRKLATLDEFIRARSIMLYYSVEREPSTHKIAQAALDMGKIVAFPYCYLGGKMEARAIKSLDELVPAMLKIPAPSKSSAVIGPEEIDLIIVPALTYDRDGFRLGYGGGYYDRYLCDIFSFTVGIARERLLKIELPREEHDVAVHCLVTEDKITRL